MKNKTVKMMMVVGWGEAATCFLGTGPGGTWAGLGTALWVPGFLGTGLGGTRVGLGAAVWVLGFLLTALSLSRKKTDVFSFFLSLV